jgi:branched-chain amino acid aminotransferase
LFWIKDKTVFTPPLNEGCVAGVMRKFLMKKIKDSAGQIEERILTGDILLDADELFLTNAVFGMRWVCQFKNKHFSNDQCTQIFQSFISPLYK